MHVSICNTMPLLIRDGNPADAAISYFGVLICDMHTENMQADGYIFTVHNLPSSYGPELSQM